MNGRFSEITFQWRHPKKGTVYVRSGDRALFERTENEMQKTIRILLAFVCALSMMGGNGTVEQSAVKSKNPHEASWISDEMAQTLDSIERIDDNGAFYEMNYTADYYDPVVLNVVEEAIKAFDTGCSAFTTYSSDGSFLFCRNYDYRHKDTDGNYTGLNVLIHFAPEGKLRSIGVCDAFWLDPSAYFSGTLDDGKTDISNLALAPYLCVDGMNEAGLAASLLVVDVKDGEMATDQDTGRQRISHAMLLRYIMDNAHNIEEAIAIAQDYDVYSTGGNDVHMFISQKDGISAVFEWRQYGDDEKQELYVTYTNAVTNFYVGFDDGQDSYRADGSLRELCVKISPTYNDYRYGYGHGYHRFNQIISSLERYVQDVENIKGIRNSIMEESQAFDLLSVTAQSPGIENTSFTQYSAIYNLADLSVSFWIQQNYEKVYTFEW